MLILQIPYPAKLCEPSGVEWISLNLTNDFGVSSNSTNDFGVSAVAALAKAEELGNWRPQISGGMGTAIYS
jgi:hypothetical protein